MAEPTTVVRESTIKDFLEVVFRRKWIVAGVVFIATFVVILLNMREPDVYESNGKMLVKRGEATGVFNTYVRTLTWDEEIASQIEMVKSQVVLERAQQLLPTFFPEGYTTDKKISYGGIGTGVISTSNVLFVTYTGPDPIFCQAAVNAVINSYREYYQKVRTPPEMEDFFSSELDRVKEDLEYWRNRKAKVETEWKLYDVEKKKATVANRIESYTNDLDEVKQELMDMESVISDLKRFRQLDIEEQATIVNSYLGEGTGRVSLQRYIQKLTDLKLKESELASNYTDDFRELKQVRAQIKDVYGLIDNEIKTALAVRERKLEAKKKREKTLTDMITALKQEQTSFPEKEVELDRINDTLARLEKHYSELQNQHMNSRIAMASNPEWNITILAPASPAIQKKTRDYVRMALGPLFSLVIALGFAFFIDNLDHSIKNVSEAEDALGLQVLSSFPDLDRK